MRKKKEYKSPVAAFLWSVTMGGFGQIYNGQYLLGFSLLLLEFVTNIRSKLNVSIMYSFHGDYHLAHNIVDYQWGIFYPSIYVFSMWQSYNKAIVINCHQDGKDPPKEVNLTGLCIGLVVGMNLGIYWHHHFLDHIEFFTFSKSPVLNGLVHGLGVGLLGHFIEKYVKKKVNKKNNRRNQFKN